MPWHLTLVGSYQVPRPFDCTEHRLCTHVCRASLKQRHRNLVTFACCLPLLHSMCFSFWARFIFPSPSSFDRSLLRPAAGWPNDVFASGPCRFSCLAVFICWASSFELYTIQYETGLCFTIWPGSAQRRVRQLYIYTSLSSKRSIRS